MKSAKNRARIIDSWSLFTTVSKIVGVTVLALLVRIGSHSRFNIVRYRAKALPLFFTTVRSLARLAPQRGLCRNSSGRSIRADRGI